MAKPQPLFQCMECGKNFYSTRAAERATFGDEGCPGCGGTDIDLPRTDEEHLKYDLGRVHEDDEPI